jgi:hypothetical protein
MNFLWVRLDRRAPCHQPACMARLIDPAHPFFRVAWRRWATAVVPGIWAVMELYNGQPFWALIFGAAAAYAAWVLIITWVEPEG